jgi:hypothetical protein
MLSRSSVVSEGVEEMTSDPAYTLDPSLLPLFLKPEEDRLRWLWTIATSEVLRQRVEKFRHFVHLGNIDLTQIKAEIERTPEEMWSYNAVRKKIAEQRKTDSIPLRDARYARLPGLNTVKVMHVQEDGETPLAKHYPKIMGFISDFAESMNSIPSRAILVRLSPREQVYPHFDIGFYYLVRDRYHLVLSSPDGSKMRCMNETSVWNDGELWWFNNKVDHEAFNQGDSWRIHLIFDLLPKHLMPLMERIKDFTPYYQDLRALSPAPEKQVSPVKEESADDSFIVGLRKQIEQLTEARFARSASDVLR